MSSIDQNALASFGRMVSSGGDQTFALGMARGYSRDRIDTIMNRRFGNDYASGGGLLRGFAGGMRIAASDANALAETGGSLDLSRIPNDPYMDPDETGGNLFKWSADVTFEGASSAVTVYGESASGNIEDLLAAAITGGMGIADQYRGKFGLGPDDTINPLTVTILTLKSIISNGSTTN
jgi:hypothetical protein